MAIDYSGLDQSLVSARSAREEEQLLKELGMETGKNLYGAWDDSQSLKTTDLLGDKFTPTGTIEDGMISEGFTGDPLDIYQRKGNWFSDMFTGHKGRLEYTDEYLKHLDAGTLPEGLNVADLSKKGILSGGSGGGPLKNFFGNLPKNKPMQTYKMGPTSASTPGPRTAGITKYNMGPKPSTNVNPTSQGITRYSGGNVVAPTSGVSAPGITKYNMGAVAPTSSARGAGITKYIGGEAVTSGLEGAKAGANALSQGSTALSQVGNTLGQVGNVLGPAGSIAGLATTDIDALTGAYGQTAAAKAGSGVISGALGTYAAVSPEPITKTLAAIGSGIAGAFSV